MDGERHRAIGWPRALVRALQRLAGRPLFAGDGGGPRSVAAPGNGQWIYLVPAGRTGSWWREKLVDLAKHDYRLEPNVTFTPDGKWIVFRSNMHGATHVYAVEVASAAHGPKGTGTR